MFTILSFKYSHSAMTNSSAPLSAPARYAEELLSKTVHMSEEHFYHNAYSCFPLAMLIPDQANLPRNFPARGTFVSNS